jgi:hypothetical protein
MAGVFATFRDLVDYLRGVVRQAEKNDRVERGAAGEFDDFLNKGKWMAVTSSNVELAAYDLELEILRIQYREGAVYAYQPVSYREALDFAQASSKGKWIWTNLRVRGKGNFHLHRKQFRLERFH